MSSDHPDSGSRDGALDGAVDALRDVLAALARRIHANPELRWNEHNAAQWIAEAVAEHAGVEVERGVGGVDTALRARVGAGGPTIAILAEYDALPEIGHACGHNLIAAGAVGAFLALARARGERPGTIQLLGTPAEEGGGGKIRLIEAGAFTGVDAAMMYHPLDRDLLMHRSLASAWIDMTFTGVPSHAASAPWDGRSALTACMDTFRLVDSQRVHLRDGVRVHGYITDGGQAVNIIPERAACQFQIRAETADELERVREVVERCARGAAMASAVDVDIALASGYRELRNNAVIARRFGAALAALGRAPRERDDALGAGSTDMGDVSHVVPAIHPYLAICELGASMCHQRSFADHAASDPGIDAMVIAAKAMARTTAALIDEPDLLAAARAEFAAD